MSFSMAAPGLLATGSTDKKVKLWDVSNHQPSLIASQDLQVSLPVSRGIGFRVSGRRLPGRRPQVGG